MPVSDSTIPPKRPWPVTAPVVLTACSVIASLAAWIPHLNPVGWL